MLFAMHCAFWSTKKSIRLILMQVASLTDLSVLHLCSAEVGFSALQTILHTLGKAGYE